MRAARGLSRTGRLAGAVALAAALACGATAAEAPGGLLPVPAETIHRGERIKAGMLTEKHFYYDPDRPLSVLTDPADAVGKAARHTLVEGEPIPLRAVRTVRLVKRGKPTQARFSVGNLTITATVLPRDDGGEGDMVRARNLDSGRVISGIVAADGAIEVPAR
jgi:flagella basal body P-ring formation protein FlgA